MKLYDVPLSPYTARCRTQIYAKGLDVVSVPPPDGMASPAFRAINPLGRIPALEVDGAVIPESDTICELLEDLHPEPRLLPADPLERARVRLIGRIVDLYLFPIEHELVEQFEPANRDAAVVAQKTAALNEALDRLEAFRRPADSFAVGSSLTLADCALFPLFFYLTRLLPALGEKNPLDERPKLAAWWQAVREHSAVSRVDKEMDAALREFLAQRG